MARGFGVHSPALHSLHRGDKEKAGIGGGGDVVALSERHFEQEDLRTILPNIF